MGHLAGDVPALFIVAAALAILTPRSKLPFTVQKTRQTHWHDTFR
jgi:hypothetical protein